MTDYGNQFCRNVVRGTPQWVVFVDGDTWTYLPNDGRFHRNQGVYEDFQFEHRWEFVIVTAEEAQTAAREQSPLDESNNTLHQVRRQPSLSVDQVLRLHRGESMQETPEPGTLSPWDEQVMRRALPPSGPPETPDGAPPLPGVDRGRGQNE